MLKYTVSQDNFLQMGRFLASRVNSAQNGRIEHVLESGEAISEPLGDFPLKIDLEGDFIPVLYIWAKNGISAMTVRYGDRLCIDPDKVEIYRDGQLKFRFFA